VSHEHEVFPFPAEARHPAPGEATIDFELIGSLVGVAFDGCTTCQDPLLTLLVEDAASTTRLVELACVATAAQLGGLPPSMHDVDHSGGLTPMPFRRLAGAGLDGQAAAMYRVAEEMSVQDRRVAANCALDTLVGMMATG
jgi:hypothetical protein